MLSLAASSGSSVPSAEDQLGDTKHQTTCKSNRRTVTHTVTRFKFHSISVSLQKRDRWILLISPERFAEDLTFQRVSVHSVLLQHRKIHVRRHRTAVKTDRSKHKQSSINRGVTSSMYSSRSRAFLKSYSLARLLSSQMYNCGEERRKR